MPADFIWQDQDEPHASRRKAILKVHPEVSKLTGVEWRTKYITVALSGLQIWLSYATLELSWPAYLLVAYVFGATLAQALFLAVHEISHNLAFKTGAYNRYLSYIANLPIVFPFSITFRGYHLEHHKFQGVDGVDTDIPSDLECKLVRGVVTKSVWASCQILAYALRPCLVRHQAITKWHVLNILTQLAFDAVVLHYWGWKPLACVTNNYLIRRPRPPPALSLSPSLLSLSLSPRFPPTFNPQVLRALHLPRRRAPPVRRPFHLGALRLPTPLNDTGDVLILRAAQRAHVERRLPQRAPRFPVRAVVAPPAAAQEYAHPPLPARTHAHTQSAVRISLSLSLARARAVLTRVASPSR